MEEPMAHIASKLTDLIGNTPLLELGNYGRQEKLQEIGRASCRERVYACV